MGKRFDTEYTVDTPVGEVSVAITNSDHVYVKTTLGATINRLYYTSGSMHLYKTEEGYWTPFTLNEQKNYDTVYLSDRWVNAKYVVTNPKIIKKFKELVMAPVIESLKDKDTELKTARIKVLEKEIEGLNNEYAQIHNLLQIKKKELEGLLQQ